MTDLLRNYDLTFSKPTFMPNNFFNIYFLIEFIFVLDREFNWTHGYI